MELSYLLVDAILIGSDLFSIIHVLGLFDCELANAVQGITTSLFHWQSLWRLPNFKHITSCLTWIDMIASNCIIKVLDKFEHVQKKEKRREEKKGKKRKDKNR